MSLAESTSNAADSGRSSSPYAYGGIDTVNVLRAKLTPDAFQGFCIGMVHKRLHRGLLKTQEARIQDFEAAQFYMDLMMESLMGTGNAHAPDRTHRRIQQLQRVQGSGGFLPPRDPNELPAPVQALFAPDHLQNQGSVAQQQRGNQPVAAQTNQAPPTTPGGGRGGAPNPYDPGSRR